MDRTELDRRLDHLIEHSTDPSLLRAIESYRGGELDTVGLFGHPAFQREVARSLSEVVDRLREDGRLEQVRESVRRIAEEEGHEVALED